MVRSSWSWPLQPNERYSPAASLIGKDLAAERQEVPVDVIARWDVRISFHQNGLNNPSIRGLCIYDEIDISDDPRIGFDVPVSDCRADRS